MSTSIPLSYCEVWQPEDFEPESSFPTEPEFFIEIYAAFTCEATPVLQYRQVNVPCDLLKNGRSNWLLLSEPLSQILVPYDVQPSVIRTIITRAREISGEPENMNRVIIPLVVSLTVTFAQEQFLDERMLPTKKAAIEELEKVNMEGCEEKQCAICLEEIEKGCEATRMPCLHVYHGSCIVNWLQKSHHCPLCRFKMPVESS